MEYDSQKKDYDENDEDDLGGERPSIVSFNNTLSNFGFNETPPERKSERELAKMTESERRRYERNLREQQRSYKISQQIKQLRDVLAESNIPFRPNKYSILVSVAEYIKQLQSRAIMLDAEHQRLIDTIRKTNEMVSSGTEIGAGDDNDDNNCFSPDFQSSMEVETSNNLLLVPGIDYRNVFDNCPYPMGIATLDGRVLAANEGFEHLLSCAKGQMVEQSLFVYIRNHQEIFEAMAALLKRSSLASETGDTAVNEQQLLYWTGQVLSPRSLRVRTTSS
jgi:PAS domain-containing protein